MTYLPCPRCSWLTLPADLTASGCIRRNCGQPTRRRYSAHPAIRPEEDAVEKYLREMRLR